MRLLGNSTAPLGLILCLVSCGDGAEDTGSFFPSHAAQTRLMDATEHVWSGQPYEHEQVDFRSDETAVLRTQLEILFRSDATVRDADRVLRAAEAEITVTVAGVSGVVVRIPDPGSLEALDAVTEALEQDPSVWMVRQAEFWTLRTLPPDEDQRGPWPRLHHHLAIGAAAAWNAVSALRATPHLIVADHFGEGPPQGLDADFDSSQFGLRGAGPAYRRGFICVGGCSTPPVGTSWHGYHVTGIATADFGGADTAARRATGVVARRARLSVADASLFGPLEVEYRALQLAAQAGGPSTLNVSLGWGCEGQDTPSCHERAREQGGAWAIKVRQAGLEDRLVIMVAAGNVERMGQAPIIETSSALIAAGIRDDLVDESGAHVPPLTNTFAVGAVRTNQIDAARVECQTSWSYQGAHVSAVGENVYSTVAHDGGEVHSGTSMASPQAAGLAAMLQSVDPDLSASEVLALISSTARPVSAPSLEGCAPDPSPAPHIDAFAAMLGLDMDRDIPVVRSALLDEDGDGTASSADVLALLDLIRAGDGVLDYGRADLNGDGRTGGEHSTRFDLNHDGVSDDRVEVLIGDRLRGFEETQASDLDVLCYLAHAATLGAPGAGQSAVERACDAGGYEVTMMFPPDVRHGLPSILEVRVHKDAAPVAGARVEVTALGTTVSSVTGTTSEQGRFTRAFVPVPGADEVSLQVTVEDAAGETIASSLLVAEVLPPNLTLFERFLSASVRATVLADAEFVDELDADSGPWPLDLSDLAANATESQSAAGASGATGSAGGDASARVNHQLTQAGDVEELVVALQASGFASFGSGGSGYANSNSTASFTYVFAVTREQSMTYSADLSGNTAYETLTLAISQREGANQTSLERVELSGAQTPSMPMGELRLSPGIEYRISLSVLAAPAQDPSGTGVGDASAEATASFGFGP